MGHTLLSNVRVFDGSGDPPFDGEVVIEGDVIKHVGRAGQGAAFMPTPAHTVIDGAGCFLMPGMVEAHTHFSWNNQPSLDAIARMPPEEHILWCAEVARTYLDMGWTSCVGAAAAKPRLDVVIRNAIADGTIIGPRLTAASQEITLPGGLGDTTQPHLPQAAFAFGAVVSGQDDMRRCVRQFCKYGVDTLKINLSGESITGMPSEQSQFTEEEIATCVQEARAWGKWVAAHARSTWSVKQCVQHGIQVIYHASFLDDEALDLLDAHRHAHFVAPGLAWLVNTCEHASAYGLTRPVVEKMGYPRELEAALESMRALHRRGVHILPGGDYGFAWMPHGQNAKDLEIFVRQLGMSEREALLSATARAAPLMRSPKPLGMVRAGYLADLLLIDGDPLTDITVLQDRQRILAVMKGGTFVRHPPSRPNAASHSDARWRNRWSR